MLTLAPSVFLFIVAERSAGAKAFTLSGVCAYRVDAETLALNLYGSAPRREVVVCGVSREPAASSRVSFDVWGGAVRRGFYSVDAQTMAPPDHIQTPGVVAPSDALDVARAVLDVLPPELAPKLPTPAELARRAFEAWREALPREVAQRYTTRELAACFETGGFTDQPSRPGAAEPHASGGSVLQFYPAGGEISA